jgi:hypothetical protein
MYPFLDYSPSHKQKKQPGFKRNCILDLKFGLQLFLSRRLHFSPTSFCHCREFSFGGGTHLLARLFHWFGFGCRLRCFDLDQRNFWAAAILALPAALIPFFFGALTVCLIAVDMSFAVEPKIWINSFSKATIFSLRSAAFLNVWSDRFSKLI